MLTISLSSKTSQDFITLLIDIKAYMASLKLEVKEITRYFLYGREALTLLAMYSITRTSASESRSNKNFARKLSKNPDHPSKASYLGWLSHCNAKHLTKKLVTP
jgi:hypothetical protein